MSISIQVKAIIPEFKLNDSAVRRDILHALQGKTVPEVKRLFRLSTEGWKHKPEWSAKYHDSPNRLSAEVYASGPNAEQYGYVNFGTKRHRIPKSGTTFMRFKWGGPGSYKASTRPRVLSSHSSNKSGQYVTKFSVNHPGLEAREFDQIVAERIIDQFSQDVQDAIKV